MSRLMFAPKPKKTFTDSKESKANKNNPYNDERANFLHRLEQDQSGSAPTTDSLDTETHSESSTVRFGCRR